MAEMKTRYTDGKICVGDFVRITDSGRETIPLVRGGERYAANVAHVFGVVTGVGNGGAAAVDEDGHDDVYVELLGRGEDGNPTLLRQREDNPETKWCYSADSVEVIERDGATPIFEADQIAMLAKNDQTTVGLAVSMAEEAFNRGEKLCSMRKLEPRDLKPSETKEDAPAKPVRRLRKPKKIADKAAPKAKLEGVAAPYAHAGLYGLKGPDGKPAVSAQYFGLVQWHQPGEEFGPNDKYIAFVDREKTQADILDASGNVLVTDLSVGRVQMDPATTMPVHGGRVDACVSPCMFVADGHAIVADCGMKAVDAGKVDGAPAWPPPLPTGVKARTRAEFPNDAEYQKYCNELLMAATMGHIALKVRIKANSGDWLVAGNVVDAIHLYDDFNNNHVLVRHGLAGKPPQSIGVPQMTGGAGIPEIANPGGNTELIWLQVSNSEPVSYDVLPPERWRTMPASADTYHMKLHEWATRTWPRRFGRTLRVVDGKPCAGAPPEGSPGYVPDAPSGPRCEAVAVVPEPRNDVTEYAVDASNADKDVVVTFRDGKSERSEYDKSPQPRILAAVENGTLVVRGDGTLTVADGPDEPVSFPDYQGGNVLTMATWDAAGNRRPPGTLYRADEPWLLCWHADENRQTESAVIYAMLGSEPLMRFEGISGNELLPMSCQPRWTQDGHDGVLISLGRNIYDERGNLLEMPAGAVPVGCGMFLDAERCLLDSDGGKVSGQLPTGAVAVTRDRDGRFALTLDGMPSRHVSALLNRPYAKKATPVMEVRP